MTSQLAVTDFSKDKRHRNVNRRGSQLVPVEGLQALTGHTLDATNSDYKDFKPQRPVCQKIKDSLVMGSNNPRAVVNRGDMRHKPPMQKEEATFKQKVISHKAEFKKNRDGMSFMIEGDVDYTTDSKALVDFKPARPTINKIPDSGIEAGGRGGRQF